MTVPMSKNSQLKGIASSTAQQFCASCEYFDLMMREQQVETVSIDMLTERIEPDSFDIPRNANLVHLCSANMKRLLNQQYGEPVQSAALCLTLTGATLTISTTDGREVSGACTQERVVLAR